MGQRLIIRNHVKGTVSNAIYYHHGAYTLDAIRIVRQLTREEMIEYTSYYYNNVQKPHAYLLVAYVLMKDATYQLRKHFGIEGVDY